MAQHWVTKATLEQIPEMQPYRKEFSDKLQAWQDGGGKAGAEQRYQADLQAWEQARAAAKAKGEREPRAPNQRNYADPATQGQPGGMLNGCIMPLAHCALKGVLFYQGENNSFTVGWKPFPKTYPAVISDWRKIFRDEQLPFGPVSYTHLRAHET